jgi:hypothetical protein
MSAGGRARTRSTFLRRALLVAGLFILLALLLLSSGHWILGIISAVIAVAAVWVYVQARSVR